MLRRLPLPRLSPDRAYILFVLFLLAVVLGVLTYTTQRIQREIIQGRLQQAAAHARLFEDRLAQTLTTVQLMLETLRDQVPRRGEGQAHLGEHLQGALRNAPFLRSLSLVGVDGEVIASSDSRNLGQKLSLEGFYPGEGGADTLRFGPPLEGRDFHDHEPLRGSGLLPVALPVSASTYLVAALNPGYFLNHIEAHLSPEEGSVDVLLADGRLLFSSQESLVPGQPHPRDLGLADFAETGAGTLEGARHDGVPALSAWRSVRAFPLLLSIHLERGKVLGEWEREVRKLTLFLGAGLLFVLLPTTLLFLREKRALGLQAQAAAALAASEARYRLTFAAVRDGIWDWDVPSGRINCDAHWFEMLGHGDQAFPVSQDKWLEMLHPEDRDRVWQQVRDSLGSERGFSVAYRQRRADGSWLWVESRGKTVAFAGPEPLRVVGTQTDISARVAAEEAVVAAARHRTALLDHIAAGVFVASPERVILEVSARGAEMFGYRPEELVGQSFSRLHVDAQSYEQFRPAYARLRREGWVQEEYPLRRKDGSQRWISVYGTWLEPGGEAVIWTMLDVTHQHQMREALQASRTRLEAIIDHFPGGLLVEDDQRRIVLVNHTFCRLFGLEEHPEGVVGENFSNCIARVRSRFSHPEHFEWQLRELGEGLEPVLGRELGLADGRVLERDYQPIAADGRLLGRLWVFWDVTTQKLQERELQRLASVDSLTGLPNRRIFLERLDLEMARISRYEQGETALLMLDLDHFKRVNDQYGHGVGDEVLQGFGLLLQSLLRRTDLAGRVGGEEFAALLPGTGVGGAVELAERLRQTLAEKALETSKGGIHITASIGITLLAHPGDSASMALARADQALYRAKEAGRNRTEVVFLGE